MKPAAELSTMAEFERQRESELARLRTDRDALAAALRPFAKIERSTFYARDENETYDVVLSNTIDGSRSDFTGQDIDRARALLAEIAGRSG